MRSGLKKILILCAFFIILGASGLKNVQAETVYSNLTSGGQYIYTSKDVKCVINGAESGLEGGHILLGDSGSAIAPCTELFQTELQAECVFDMASCSITYTNGSSYITFSVGNDTADVNGTEKTFAETPVVLQDSTGVSRLYAPSRLVAETIGITYNWDKSTSTITVKKNLDSRIISDNSGAAMEFPLFDGITEKDVEVTENFKIVKKSLKGTENYIREIIVTIPGENAAMYKRSKYLSHCDEITSISVANENGKTKFTFTLSVIRACKASVNDNKLLLTFMAPWEAYKKIVVIDPGHGGLDSGAHRPLNGVEQLEKTINLAMAYTYTHELFENSDIKVYYTRTDDTYLSLYARRMLSVEVHADMFVSIHQNTSGFATDAGTMVFYSKEKNNYEDANGFCSEVLARAFSQSFSEYTSLRRLGLFTDKDTATGRGYDVTTLQGKEVDKSTGENIFIDIRPCPAILIETGFLSNSSDLPILVDAETQKAAGKAIFETIKQLFNEYPRVRTD